MPNYYAFRTDRNHRNFMYAELQAGRLRQGWGFEAGQNLRNQTVDKGAAANLKMLNVEKGDILLIPGLPSSTEVTIVEATVDWSASEQEGGYRFNIHSDLNDYGHIFPVKILKVFERHHAIVPAAIRRTFRTPMRFWSLNGYVDEIEAIMSANESLTERSLISDRVGAIITNAYEAAFNQQKFRKILIDGWYANFGAAEWEEALVISLSAAYPGLSIEKVGGSKEQEHGTDILIRIPHPFGFGSYGVAVQVKDYSGEVNPDHIVTQVNKAVYWETVEDIKIIEKIVLLTDVERSRGLSWIDRFPNVRFVFSDDLAVLLPTYADTLLLSINDKSN